MCMQFCIISYSYCLGIIHIYMDIYVYFISRWLSKQTSTVPYASRLY